MKIRIHGIKDGKHSIELSKQTSAVPDIFPEFIGDIKLSGVLTKHGNRYNFVGTATCSALFVCDISLEEYEESIATDVAVSIIANTEMYFMQQRQLGEEFSEIAIHEDDEFYDITPEVKDLLVVSLPMRRLSPKYIGKSFEEMHPEFFKKETTNDRWASLKNLQLPK